MAMEHLYSLESVGWVCHRMPAEMAWVHHHKGNRNLHRSWRVCWDCWDPKHRSVLVFCCHRELVSGNHNEGFDSHRARVFGSRTSVSVIRSHIVAFGTHTEEYGHKQTSSHPSSLSLL